MPPGHAALLLPQIELEEVQLDAEDLYPDSPCPDW